MPRHIAEADLALFASGDVSMWKYAVVCLHIARCEACRTRGEVYRQGRQNLKQAASGIARGRELGPSVGGDDRQYPRGSGGWRMRGAPAQEAACAFRHVEARGHRDRGRRRAVRCVVAESCPPPMRIRWLGRSAMSRILLVYAAVKPTVPVVLDRGPESQGAMVQVSPDGVELKQNGVPVPATQAADSARQPAVHRSRNQPAGTVSPPSPANDSLTVTMAVAVNGQTPNTKIDLPKGQSC